MAVLFVSTMASAEQNVVDDNGMVLQYRHAREEFAADLAAQKPLRTSMSSVARCLERRRSIVMRWLLLQLLPRLLPRLTQSSLMKPSPAPSCLRAVS